jgi:hypothetical protein
MLRDWFRRGPAVRALTLVCCAALVGGEPSDAKLVPTRNPFDGALDAELVVIVKQAGAGAFVVEDVFFGTARTGTVIVVPNFKLSTPQQYGPDIVEAITENTRILMFLRHNAAQVWELTGYDGCFFWVQDDGQLFQLQNTAKRAIDARKSWEQAVQISEPSERVAALWEFVFRNKYGRTFFEHTMAELRKAGVAAGDYIAEKFDGMSWNERSPFYNEAGVYGSERLHEKLISDLGKDRKAYEVFVSGTAWSPKDVFSHWNELPESLKDLYGEVYYGLAGIASFKARGDLPLIRRVALWAVDNRLEQPCEAALEAFRDMPDPENLVVISAIQKEFPEIE